MNDNNHPPEEWRGCIGFPGYEVSNLGRVRSLDRTITAANGRVRTYKGQLLKLHRNPDGYLLANLSIGGLGWRKLVHVLVAHAFLGEQPEGTDVHHENRHRSDNRATNLAYKPGPEHLSNHFSGENNPAAKLNEKKLTTMRRLICEGKSQREIARILQVNQSTICRAAAGETWKHAYKHATRPDGDPAQMQMFLDFELTDLPEKEF